jgi:hypothetical protein
MLSNVISAMVGAAAALVFAVARDIYLKRSRRKNVASALVIEFRVLDRKIRADLKAAEEHAVVVFDPPFSESLHDTVLQELPDLGSNVFLRVRAVYSQLRQISYLKKRLNKIRESKEPQLKDGLFESYASSCRQAVNRIDEALRELKPHCSIEAFSKELPVITNLTEEERKWWQGV